MFLSVYFHRPAHFSHHHQDRRRRGTEVEEGRPAAGRAEPDGTLASADKIVTTWNTVLCAGLYNKYMLCWPMTEYIFKYQCLDIVWSVSQETLHFKYCVISYQSKFGKVLYLCIESLAIISLADMISGCSLFRIIET